MDLLPGGLSVALYVLVFICGTTLLAMWFLSRQSRRNAGFVSKHHLRRQLSAKAVVRATEIRPSLARGGQSPDGSSTVRLAKGTPTRDV